jgi:hypothetical protein
MSVGLFFIVAIAGIILRRACRNSNERRTQTSKSESFLTNLLKKISLLTAQLIRIKPGRLKQKSRQRKRRDFLFCLVEQ